MLGAGAIALLDLFKSPNVSQQITPLLAGFLAAIITGFVAIHWLLRYLQRRALYIFSVYCLVIGLGGIALYALRG